MTCPKCNHKLPDDSEFCQYCGSKIEASTIESDDNKVEVKEEPITEEVIIPTTDNETVAKILASGIVEGQMAMEANKESQPHNELDADFGLIPQKPIYTVGIDEQEKYLKSLRTVNGEPIKWNRRGSMSVDDVNGMVDVYDTYLPSGEEYKTIYINMYGASNSTFAPKGFSYEVTQIKTSSANNKSTKSQGSKKRKLLVIIAIIVLSLVLIIAGTFVALAIVDNVQQKEEATRLENQYYELKKLMLNVNGTNYGKVADLIDQLTTNYKDVENIEKQYNQIKKYIETIVSAKFNSEKDSEKTREAYAALYQFNDQNHNWDLSDYLDDVLENKFGRLVFGKKWENSNYYFQWYEDGDGESLWIQWDGERERLWTNLPSDKNYNKKYYFYKDYDSFADYRNPRKFGYKNANNSSDKFLAYRITDISYTGSKWQIKIYCYSNSRTYTLN